MKTYDAQIFNEELRSQNWNCVYEAETVDEAWNNFKNIFIKVIDKVAPVKEMRIKQRTEPWITTQVLDMIKEKDGLISEYKKDKNNKDKYDKFCKSRNKLQQNRRKIKSEYISDKIQENYNNSKKLWKQLKNLGYSGKLIKRKFKNSA